MSVQKIFIIGITINLILIVIGVLIGNPPEQYFSKEGTYITWVSFTQLIILANITFKIFSLTKTAKDPSSSSVFFWFLICLAFSYLSIDEVLRIHENLDSIIHRTFHLPDNRFTDRLDDAIIGIYGLVGIILLFIFRGELKKFKNQFFLIAGFVLFFLMVFFDISGNRGDIVRMFVHDKAIRKLFISGIKVFEEAFKLFAETCFITGFYSFYKQLFYFRLNNEKA